MKALHITSESNGYEEVELLANRVSRTNGLAVIEINGEILMTGGFLIQDTPEIRIILDNTSKDKQYDLIKSIKMDPFSAFYYE